VAIIALSDGTLFQLTEKWGAWITTGRSYSQVAKDWQAGDEIQVSYVGGFTGWFNPYKIVNETRHEEVWGSKLDSL
jgi:hypothetical protein